MDVTVARQMLRTLEPVHGMIYFVDEALEAYTEAGLVGRQMGYFASRSAALGPVTAGTVIATFFNFNPELVGRSIPMAWTLASPERILGARFGAADRALRRMLGDAVRSSEMREAAELARRATWGCRPEGRALYAAHAELEWPPDSEAHLVLWHAQTLLREFRGDGHVASLVAEGVSGIESLVVHQATGDVPPGVLQTSRGWSDEEWERAEDRVRERGWIDHAGSMTEVGRRARDEVENLTDRLAIACWEPLGVAACTRLRELVRPWSRTISEQTFSAL